MHSRKIAWALIACALALGNATATAAAAPRGEQRAVTLITGDKVLVDAGGRVLTVHPGAGREHVKFTKTQDRGHTSVVPHDALAALAQDKLDRRLFDVTTLLEFGYEDARTNQLPLIVGGHGVLSARSAGAFTALRDNGQKVWLDGIRKPSLDKSVKQIGAPAAHRAGITGKGVKVAVLDTGVDANHPDLKGKQAVEKNFTDDPDNTDNVGHGTHVGSTIASGGATYGGVAPDAQIMDGKVCVDYGCRESWILDGMRWAAEEGAAVVNLSLGGPDSEEIDPLEEMVNVLSEQHGTLFVIAAGNSGYGGKETVASPGSAEAALTVGAVDRDESIAPFSSRGPRIGDGAIKPDVTAPGVGIVAAKAGTADHIAYSGTSMATPHVAGAAALIKQQHPDWTGAQIKALLTSTAKPNPALGAFDQGAGRIDVAKAITQPVVSLPSNAAFGLQRWPHADDPLLTRHITYLNPTSAAITFDVKVESNAPAGLFSLGGTKVTVPAGGKASVPLVADTRAGAKDGVFTGQVTATSGALTVRTPFSVNREVESYDVTMEVLDREGKPSDTNFMTFTGVDVDKSVYPSAPAGSAKLRLPKGKYNAYGYVLSGGGFDMLVRPEVVVSGDAKVTFDARQAKPVDIKIPDQPGDFQIGELGYTRTIQGRPYGFTLISFGGFGNTRSLHIGGDLPADQMSSMVAFQSNSASDDATFYRFAWEQPGRFYTGFTAAPQKKELARTETKFASVLPGAAASKGAWAVTDRGGGGSAIYQVPAGKTAVDYFTTSTRWEHLGYLDRRPDGAGAYSGAKRYVAGETYPERLFFGVTGPALPESQYPYAGRDGDDLFAGIPLFADENNGSGSSSVESAKSALYRDGVLVGETDRVGGGYFQKLPAAAGSYRLETEARRTGGFELSTTVKAAWTFRSARTQPGEPAPLPVAVVKFRPKLDDTTSTKPGLLRVPFTVQRQAGGSYGRVDVEYSFDDGKSWRRAGVVGDTALIHHPDANGYVSLRAKASDDQGNSFEQTVIRAYKVTAR
ncbi:S8 family serine peptidase [Lentzea tibetensis]|uniref:S8 family serine peptidase n=1 Tax=Lentzea tibetensis TaxID=2591470 RepID=A0A563EM05_9PSEU|nr:S8 family serine peptidase [Lentzea tibetensis]TWP48120.1 S8 family serine peptidase [Lentzea tibetensis]